MRTPRLVLAAFALLATLSCFSDRNTTEPPLSGADCSVPGSAIGTNHVVVFVRQFRFMPDTVRIRPGTTVTWVNCEPSTVEPHTSTSTTDVWDSGPFGPGASYTRTFASAGSFSYFCRPHPSMTGAVIVN